MKLSLMLLLTVGLLAIGLAGCDSDTGPEAPEKQSNVKSAEPQAKPEQAAQAAQEEQKPPLTEKALLHRKFVLKTANGVDYSTKERPPTLEFNEGFRVSGGICNRFSGQAELKGSTLTVRQMAFTRMLCADQDLNALEAGFAVMLDKGAAVALDGRTLTLSGNGLELTYEPSEPAQ